MNNKSIALNILFIPHSTEKISHEHQVITSLLMITDGQKQHYLAVK